MTNDTIEAIDRAVRAYFDGSDKSKINLREAMSDLRVCYHAEVKARAQQETTTIVRPDRSHA
jgi:hypothetical protein